MSKLEWIAIIAVDLKAHALLSRPEYPLTDDHIVNHAIAIAESLERHRVAPWIHEFKDLLRSAK